MYRDMIYVLFLCCIIIGFASSQMGPDSTIASELVTNSDADVASASTQSSGLAGQNANSSAELVDFVSSRGDDRQCPSDSSKPCVVKCCPLGESIGPEKVCERSNLTFQVKFFSSNFTAGEEYNYIFGDPCVYGKYRLEPHEDSSDEFHVLRNGSIRAPYLFPFPLQPRDYCLEVFWDPNFEEEDVLPLICFTEPPSKAPKSLHYILYPIGLLISVPFLIVTMLVYLLIPELRDLHGKSLSCHVTCLAVAYIFLATVQLSGETLDQSLCVIVAFVIHFSFVACFFWLNVLCINTWWNVSANVSLRQGSKDSSRDQYWYYTLQNDDEVRMLKHTERKVFYIYSLYAWCCPIIFVVVSMTLDLLPTIPSSYLKPNFGDNKCWFSSQEAELQYFYGPVAVLIGFNILLFILTAYKVYRHELTAPRHKARQMFRMCLTLFGVMGINWVMEVVSWAAGGPDYIWYVTDFINTLQGVIIFCVFVLEPRIRECVRREWGPKLSKILCHRRTPFSHANIRYSTPKNAANDVHANV